MKIDAFVSTLDNTENRKLWSRQCIEALLAEPTLRVTVIDAGSPQDQLEWFQNKGVDVIHQPKEGSLFRRFLIAEAYAQSELYLFCDNDMIPKSDSWLSRGLEIMRSNPTFGYVVYRMTHTDFMNDNSFRTPDVRGIAKGGGWAIVRRDCRTHPFRIPFVPDLNNMDDFHYCTAIKKSGFGVGMFESLYVEHCGRSESTH